MTSNHRRYNPHGSHFIYHFGWGFRFFFSGARMIFRHRALLGLSLIPILVTVVLLLALAFGMAWLYGELLADAIDARFRLFAQALIFLFALLAGYFLYLPLARIILAPFAEALSRKAHLISTGTKYQSEVRWARAMLEGLKLVLLHLVISLGALALGIVFPPIGAPVGIVIAVFLCGLDFFDIPLSARGLRLGKKLKVIFHHKALALGFGLAAYLMLLVPGLNLLTLPAGVIGATLLSDALERK